MKNIGIIKASVLAILSGLLLLSCNDDELLDKSGKGIPCDYICFGVSSDNNATTRGFSRSNEYTANRFVLRSKTSKDTLCVRTVVSDGIDVSNNTATRPTRGVPVTGTGNFYDKFHVLAYMKQNGTPSEHFFFSQDAVKDGSTWKTNTIYYWPGDEYEFDFCAYAPIDAAGLTSPTTPASKTLSYTVPDAATDQKDILVATADGVKGDLNEVQPLNFKHILSAVKFVVGSEMRIGSIKSITLENVKSEGDYNMANGSWNLGNQKNSFSQNLNKSMNGSEGGTNTGITTDEGTFMMLPQTLDGVTVKVVFTTVNKGDITLTASLSGEWEMGKTTTYRLSITPEYDIEIDVPDQVDAHYLIVPITVNAKDLDGRNDYTIRTKNATVCKFRENLVGPEEQGYWPDESTSHNDFARVTSITGSTGTKTFYAFITENAGTSDRDIELEILCNNKVVQTKTIKQKCPNWVGNTGWEQIEEVGAKPYGFVWNRVVRYKSKKVSVIGIAETYIPGNWLISQYKQYVGTGVTIQESSPLLWLWKPSTITFDYGKITSSLNAFDESNGLANTLSLDPNFIVPITESESNLMGSPFIEKDFESGSNENISDFAALVCIKKNKCKVTKETGDEGQIFYNMSFATEDIVWYLPAINQFNGSVGLSGEYWSSTAINESTNAYSWNNGAKTVTYRADARNVRAVRKK